MKINILVVDDDQLVNDFLTEVLTRTGHNVDTCLSGEEALEEIADKKYDLLIVISNTYAFTPDSPTTRHLERIGDLNGMNTVLLTLGSGSATESKKFLENMIQDQNGTIIKSILVYSLAPNEGDKSPTEYAKQTAQEII